MHPLLKNKDKKVRDTVHLKYLVIFLPNRRDICNVSFSGFYSAVPDNAGVVHTWARSWIAESVHCVFKRNTFPRQLSYNIHYTCPNPLPGQVDSCTSPRWAHDPPGRWWTGCSWRGQPGAVYLNNQLPFHTATRMSWSKCSVKETKFKVENITTYLHKIFYINYYGLMKILDIWRAGI